MQKVPRLSEAASGDATYEGGWLNSQKHGHGSLTLKVRWQPRFCLTAVVYCSRLSDVKPRGRLKVRRRPSQSTSSAEFPHKPKGTVSWCKGQFKHDKKEGKGIYHYPSGAKYSGDWAGA